MAKAERLLLQESALQQAYRQLYESYGPQYWWPAKSPFEVMVGAVLVQNTNWSNVERAIASLQAEFALTPQQILNLGQERLAERIRSAGYYRIKAARLSNLCRYVIQAGGEQELEKLSTSELRRSLLGISGVGPETADDILLYAFARPVFVIDAYTRRIFSRIGWIHGGESYDALRIAVEAALPQKVELFNEFHALLVRHAKVSCHKRIPECNGCALDNICKKMKI